MSARLEDWRRTARTRLTASDDEDAAWDADWMLCELTGLNRSSLRFHADDALTDGQIETLSQWLDRRGSGEPLQYILGSTGFMGLTFRCDSRALIPRQDTETLVELALERMRDMSRPRVLDLCCGTGAIGLSAAHYRPDAVVALTDISPDALALAEENAALLNVKNVRFAQGDLFEAVSGERFDVILSNPPYLTAEDMRSLQREVRREPALALDGGEDGLDFYRRIAREAPRYLNAGGLLMVEIGAEQGNAVRELMTWASETAAHRDLCGLDRVVEAHLRG